MQGWQDLLRKIWRVDNVPVLIALVGGIAAMTFPFFGNVSVGRALQLIMIVLLAIVLSLGLDRIQRLWNIERRLDDIDSALQGLKDPTADAFLKARREKEPPLFELGKEAREVAALGVSLKELALATDRLDELVKDGALVKLLIWKFDESLATAAARSLNDSVNSLRDNYNLATRRFRDLRKRTRGPGYRGSFEIKQQSSIPRVAMIMFDGDTPRGRMQVEILPFDVPAFDRPTFRLTRHQTRGWYYVFLTAFNKAWAQADVLPEE